MMWIFARLSSDRKEVEMNHGDALRVVFITTTDLALDKMM